VAHAAVWDVRFHRGRAPARRDRHPRRALAGHAGPRASVVRVPLVLARRAVPELAIDRGPGSRAESDVRAMRTVFDRCVGVPGAGERAGISGRCVSASAGRVKPSSTLAKRRRARRAGRRHVPGRATPAGGALDGPARGPLRPRPAGRCGGISSPTRPETAASRPHPASRARSHSGHPLKASMRRSSLLLVASCAVVAACGPSMGTQGSARSPQAAQSVRPGEGELPRSRLRRRPRLGTPRHPGRPARCGHPRAVAAHPMVRLDFDEALRLTEGLARRRCTASGAARTGSRVTSSTPRTSSRRC